jgi:hypothetical protein
VIATAIDDGGTYQQAQGAVESVFGQLGADAIKSFAEGGADSVGQSMNDILQASSLLGVFGKAAGLADGDLVDFSENLITLGADLSAFANTTPEQAVEALSAGLRGESEPLRQYGVLLDDATLKARAMEMGIYDGNGPLTQQQRILAAYNEILAQTGDQQGTFAEESDTLAGSQARTAAAFENISTQIGTAFLPIAEQLSSWFLEKGIPALQEFADWLNKPETQEGIANFVGFLTDFMGKLMLGAEQIGDFIETMKGKFELGAQQIGDFFSGIFGWFQAFADRLALGQSQVFGFFGAIGAKFALGAEQIGDFARTVGQKIGEAIGFVGSLPGKIGEALAGAGTWLYETGRDLIQGFVNGITSMVDGIYTAITDTVGGAIDWAKDLLGIQSPSKVFREIGEYTSLGYARGIESEYGAVRSASSGMVAAAVPDFSNGFMSGTLALAGDGLSAYVDGRVSYSNAERDRMDNAGRRRVS